MALIGTTELEGIARVFCDGDAAREVKFLEKSCQVCGIEIDFGTGDETWRSLFEALRDRQTGDGDRRAILAFLRVAMQPDNYITEPDIFSSLRENLNEHLVPCGLLIDKDGSLKSAGSDTHAPMQTWAIAGSSFVSTFKKFGLVLKLSWAPFLAYYIAFFLLDAAVERLHVPSVLRHPRLWEFYASVLFSPFGAVFLVAWHRYILLGEIPKQNWFYFRLAEKEKLFTLAMIVFLSFRISQVATNWGYVIFLDHKITQGENLDQLDVLIGLFMEMCWTIVLLAISTRLLWVFPEIAIGRGMSLRRCWQRTRGYTWRLALGLALILVPIIALKAGVEVLLAYLGETGLLADLGETGKSVITNLYWYFVAVFTTATVATYLSRTYKLANAADMENESFTTRSLL